MLRKVCVIAGQYAGKYVGQYAEPKKQKNFQFFQIF